VDDTGSAIDPGLLWFAAYVVRALAQDARTTVVVSS